MIYGLPKDGDNRFTEKIDVLDLLINIIHEHEEKLDLLVEKMEIIATVIEANPQRFKEGSFDAAS